ncbi:MAG: zinc-binding dehydrogenase, partial [Kineosporiaceae bacterium]
MGTREELQRLVSFCELTGVRPVVDSVLPLEDARDGFVRMAAGDVFGKIVFSRP